MTDLQNKTPEELQKIIADAQKHLEAIYYSNYKKVITEIKELAASIGVTVEIHEDGKKIIKKATSAVPVKFRNPNDSAQTWTGRGMTPTWLKALIAEGHDMAEFLINTQH